MGQKFILVMLEMLMTTKAVPLAIAYTIVEAVFLLLQTAVKPMESDESDAKAATLVMVQLVTMLFGVFFVMEVAIEGGTIHTLMTFFVLAVNTMALLPVLQECRAIVSPKTLHKLSGSILSLRRAKKGHVVVEHTLVKLTNSEIKDLVSAIQKEPTLTEDGSFDDTVSSLVRYNEVFGSSSETKHLSEVPELLRGLGIQPALITDTDIENLVNMCEQQKHAHKILPDAHTCFCCSQILMVMT